MTFHIVTLTDSIQLMEYTCPPSLPVTIGATVYHQLPGNYDEVFYDLIIGSHSEIRGLQLQIARDHSLSRAILAGIHVSLAGHIEFLPFLRLWFSTVRAGKEVGAEGFGDLMILEGGHRAIGIGFSSCWLRNTSSSGEQLH